MDATLSMDIWASINKKNTFQNDFFRSSNSEEVWSTDLETGNDWISNYNGKFASFYLRNPGAALFTYEQ